MGIFINLKQGYTRNLAEFIHQVTFAFLKQDAKSADFLQIVPNLHPVKTLKHSGFSFKRGFFGTVTVRSLFIMIGLVGSEEFL